tara:strand:+ start:563 stop:769 length:207 start_codon:yes stop_codon:yes gene_type:complete
VSAFLEGHSHIYQRKKISARVFYSLSKRRRKSRRNRKRFIEEEKERDDGLTLFLTAEKTPLSFEEEAL